MTPPTGWIQKLYTIAAQISCQTSRVEDGNYVIISRYSLNCSLHCFLTLLESKCSPGKDRNIRQLWPGARFMQFSLGQYTLSLVG